MELVTARRRCCGAMIAGATGGLEYSLRWGCVANTAHNKTKGAVHLGLVCLVTAQTFPGAAALFVDRNGIPLLASGHRVQTWSKVERQHFSGCCLSAFPHKTAETRGNQHHSGEEGAMADTAEKEEYTYQIDKIKFIVTPVYKEEGETMGDILLKLMLAELDPA